MENEFLAMKPTLIEWIPFYGMSVEKRSLREAIVAQWFEMYHITTVGMIILYFIND